MARRVMARLQLVLTCALCFGVSSSGHSFDEEQALIMEDSVPTMPGLPRRASHTASHKHKHRCKHSEVREPRTNRKPMQYSSRRSSTEPIRLHFHTDSLDSLPTAQKNYILGLLNDANDWFRQALNVIPSSGSLQLELICKDASDPCLEYYAPQCGNFTDIPNSLVTTGVIGADTLIFVSAQFTEICADGSTLAYAQACQRDQFDRPTIGWINFCPSEILVETDARDIAHDLETAIHEITHILGFSPSSFAFFRDEDGVPRTPRCPEAAGCGVNDLDGDPPYDFTNYAYEISTSTVQSRTARGRSVQELVTPEVRRLAREHFGCSSLQGAELEEFGGGGTAGSHFEKRVLHTELMVGSLGRSWESKKSTFTLGVLQDSGWYRVNYTAADPIVFGKGGGCEFVNQQCDPDDEPWCNANIDSMCTFNRAAIGFCQIATWSSALPSYFQYFADPQRGGPDSLMDYCPLPTPYTNTRCDGNGEAATRCGSDFCRGEAYGADSACFESSAVVDGYVNTWDVEGACYRYRCVEPASESGSTTLEVFGGDGVWHSCNGVSSVSFSGYSGVVACPAAAEVCFDATVNQPATSNPGLAGGSANTPANAIACSGACVCSAGYYEAGQATSCLPCPAGTFKEGVGAGPCVECGDKSFSSAGSTREEDCECNSGLVKQDGVCVSASSQSSDSILLYAGAGGGGVVLLAVVIGVGVSRRKSAPVAPAAAAAAASKKKKAAGHAGLAGAGAAPAPDVVVAFQDPNPSKPRLDFVPFHHIVDLQWVASGGFKTVYKAKAPFEDVPFVDVAMTVLLQDVAGRVARPLPMEAMPRHPRLNPITGTSVDPAGQVCLLSEWAPGGSLYQTLARMMTMNTTSSNASLLAAGTQIAEGLAFIAASGFIHRSLSLRSVMVFSYHPGDPRLVQVKIGDQVLSTDRARLGGTNGSFKNADVFADLVFRRAGLVASGQAANGTQVRFVGEGANPGSAKSQVLRLNTPQFVPNAGVQAGVAVPAFPYGLPEGAPSSIRWMAPEVVTHGAWSDKSDAWALGVTLCEMWMVGPDGAPADPFPGMSNQEVGEHLSAGKGHEVPEMCPPMVASVVVLCNEATLDRRLSPQQAHDRLQAALNRIHVDVAMASQCVACGKAGGLVGLSPCGHLCLCLDDARRLDETDGLCPVCCQPVQPGRFMAGPHMPFANVRGDPDPANTTAAPYPSPAQSSFAQSGSGQLLVPRTDSRSRLVPRDGSARSVLREHLRDSSSQRQLRQQGSGRSLQQDDVPPPLPNDGSGRSLARDGSTRKAWSN